MSKLKLLQTIQKAIKTKAFIAIVTGVVVVGGGISAYTISQNRKTAEAANTKDYVALDANKESSKEDDKSKVEEKKVEEVKPAEQPKAEEKKDDTNKTNSDNNQNTNSAAATNSSSKTSSGNTSTTPKSNTTPANSGTTSKPSTPTPTPQPTGAQPPSGYNGEVKMYNASLSQQVNSKLGLNRNTAFYSTLHPETLKTALADDPEAYSRDGNYGLNHFIDSFEMKQMYLYQANGKKYAYCRHHVDIFNINSNDVSSICQTMKNNGLLSIENIVGTELNQTYFETFVIYDKNSKTNKVVRIYMTFSLR